MFDDSSKVVGQGVDVVACWRPVGAAVGPAVVQHAVRPGTHEGGNLVIPLVGAQAPRMGEDDRRAAAPVSDEQAGLGGGFDEWHNVVLPRPVSVAAGTGRRSPPLRSWPRLLQVAITCEVGVTAGDRILYSCNV